MKTVYEIDKDGFMTYRTADIDVGSPVPPNYVSEGLPTDSEGNQLPFWRPRWDGEMWSEGKSQEEFDEEKVLESLTPSPEEMYNADFEIRMITLLFEMEVI